jgi:hypothetical protein
MFTLLYMTPSGKMFDIGDSRSRDAVLCRNLWIRPFVCPDSSDIIFSQFKLHTTPRNHVYHIVCLSSWNKVIRIAAGRCIAGVSDNSTVISRSFWNPPIGFLIGSSMRDNVAVFFFKKAISIGVNAALPGPAFFRRPDSNETPKVNLSTLLLVHAAFVSAKNLLRRLLNHAKSPIKSFATPVTLKGDKGFHVSCPEVSDNPITAAVSGSGRSRRLRFGPPGEAWWSQCGSPEHSRQGLTSLPAHSECASSLAPSQAPLGGALRGGSYFLS